MNSKTLTLDECIHRIPAKLMERFRELESKFANGLLDNCTGKIIDKIAAFDLDNTLVDGDVGNAVFGQLKIDEQKNGGPLGIVNKKMELTWDIYQDVLDHHGKEAAYPLMTTTMDGIPANRVIDATRRVMNLTERFFDFEDTCFPVPFPHPVMQAVIFFLESLGYQIYIISATNIYSVRYVAFHFFGIPAERVIAMTPSVYTHDKLGEIIGSTINGPITVTEGKVEAYRQYIGQVPPLITGGDSTTDIPMLNLTHREGIILWKGLEDDKENSWDVVRRNIRFPKNVYFIDGDSDDNNS